MKRQPANSPEPTHRPLREFFYLDEVSVQSLASAVGQALMIGRVETVESTNKKSRKLSLGGKAGPAAGNFTLGREQVHADASQVEAKYNIQATFAQLKDVLGASASLALQPWRHPQPTGSNDGVSKPTLDALRLAHSAIPIGQLSRGAVIELRAEINAHPMFAIASLADSLSAIASGSPGVFGVGGPLQQITDGANILNHMLGGLVPIEGRVTSHQIVELPDGIWIVPSEEAKALSGATSVRDIRIVGVMERELFWRDPRRILFENLEYTVFGRATHDGVRDTWMPSKWFGPLNGMMSKFIDEIGQIDLTPALEQPTEVDAALNSYIEAISTEFGLQPSPTELGGLPLKDSGSLEEGLSLFDLVAHRSFGDQMADVDRDQLAKIRESVMQDAGLLLPNESKLAASKTSAIQQERGPLLELDFVAGYW